MDKLTPGRGRIGTGTGEPGDCGERIAAQAGELRALVFGNRDKDIRPAEKCRRKKRHGSRPGDRRDLPNLIGRRPPLRVRCELRAFRSHGVRIATVRDPRIDHRRRASELARHLRKRLKSCPLALPYVVVARP